MKHTMCYIKDFPRVQFVRESFEILNGKWDFCKDYGDNGVNKEYYHKFPESGAINVPYAYQTEASGVEDKSRCDVVWYNREFNFSSRLKDGKRVFLNFEGADYYTQVWVNGKFVGENKGGYHRFGFDISGSLIKGMAKITVRTEDTYDASVPRGKQKWEDKRFGCWYTETTGIWKTVWVEFVMAERLESVGLTPNVSDNLVKLDYVINGCIKGLSLKTVISFNGATVASDIVEPVRNSFARSISVIGETEPFKTNLWSENCPALYDVEYTLYKDGKLIDKVGSYFGMRKFAASGNIITLNDCPIYLRMTLDQGYFFEGALTPNEEQLIEDIRLTKELGFNGIRKHQKIEDERFYYYCDVMGMCVWLEMPSAYEFNNGFMQAFTNEWIKIVEQHSKHPCIMAYVPFNESWGVPRIASNFSQQQFTEGIYHLTKALADGFVISNDGWEHTRSDIITLHNYEQDGLKLASALNDLKGYLASKKSLLLPPKNVFAEGYSYDGQPVILSEFGGIAFEKDKQDDNWGYGASVNSKSEYLERLALLLKAVYNCHELSGFCITQTTDVEQEVNGIMDFNRKPKADKEALRKIMTNS